MAYRYLEHRPFTLTDEGQRLLLKIYNFAGHAIRRSGCVQAEEMLNQMGAGSSWDQMAVIDRLVELEVLTEVPQAVRCAWQHKIFKAGPNLPSFK